MLSGKNNQPINYYNGIKSRWDEQEIFGTTILMKVVGATKLKELIGESSGDIEVFEKQVREFVKIDLFNDNENINDVLDYLFSIIFKNGERAREATDRIYFYANQIKEDMYEKIAQIPLSDKESFCGPMTTTPAFINKLCIKILGVKDEKEKKLLDVCSGTGRFLMESGRKYKDISLYGQELLKTICSESKARLMLVDRQAEIKEGNVISNTIGCEDNYPKSYDYIFSQPPFGSQNHDQMDILETTMRWGYHFNDLGRGNRSSELMYAACIIDLLKEEGKGCLLGSAGMLFRPGIEKKWRKQLIQDRKIEAIIHLPQGVIPGVGVEAAILVLGHNSEKVKMIDARKVFTKKRREKTMTDEDIDMVYKMFTGEIDGSKTCEYKDFLEKDYNLTPAAYLVKKIKNPVKLGDGGMEILPGIEIIGKKAEERYDDSSEYEALSSSDFDKFGEVGTLQRIKGTENEFGKYIVKKEDLILTAKGSAFKSMVADFDEHRKVVLTSRSLIIVRMNRNIWNPYYVKMFFDSKDGQEIIDVAFTGTIMKGLSIKTLGDIELSHIPIEEQNKIAEGYVKRRDEYRKAMATVKECEEKYFNYYDEEVGGQENE